MPIYSYFCKKCNAPFEQYFTSMSKAEPFLSENKCPNCGEVSERTLDGAPQVFFKGGGWTARSGSYYSNPSDPTKGNKIDPHEPGALHRE